MALSRARKTFRGFLGLMLILSIGFFGTAVYFYVSVKKDKAKLLSMAPTLFQIDVYQYQAQAAFSDMDGKHKIAASLVQKGLFSRIYSDAGRIMLKDLADQGHAPSQTMHANILMHVYPFNEENRKSALSYFEKAAAQDYAPAKEMLIALAVNQ